jgi:Mg-chelatase subunit ChlD
MQGTFGRVKKELADSINSLLPEHYFSLIFFGAGRLFEFEDGRLVRAADKIKASAMEFIESIKPAGQTNAMQAMEAAVRVCDNGGSSPSVIYLLTDGFELTSQDQDRFAQQICNLVKTFAPQASVNTIGLWPQDEDCKLLKALASRTGGECVIITENKNSADADLRYTADLKF